MGTMTDRVHNELTEDDVQKIASVYHAWRGDASEKAEYHDVLGFCKSVSISHVLSHDSVLTPGRYVGTVCSEKGDVKIEVIICTLVVKLESQMDESENITRSVREKLKELGYGK
jgi:type I restriction enzyme M protein